MIWSPVLDAIYGSLLRPQPMEVALVLVRRPLPFVGCRVLLPSWRRKSELVSSRRIDLRLRPRSRRKSDLATRPWRIPLQNKNIGKCQVTQFTREMEQHFCAACRRMETRGSIVRSKLGESKAKTFTARIKRQGQEGRGYIASLNPFASATKVCLSHIHLAFI